MSTGKSAIGSALGDKMIPAPLSLVFNVGESSDPSIDEEETICVKSTTNKCNISLTQLAALSDRILCPTAEAVQLTDKPAILGATRGPLGGYFRAPEHFRLHRNADVSPSLLEARMFAETIGFPVLLKGPRQGAIQCKNWSELRTHLSSTKWAQGGFIQRLKMLVKFSYQF